VCFLCGVVLVCRGVGEGVCSEVGVWVGGVESVVMPARVSAGGGRGVRGREGEGHDWGWRCGKMDAGNVRGVVCVCVCVCVSNLFYLFFVFFFAFWLTGPFFISFIFPSAWAF